MLVCFCCLCPGGRFSVSVFLLSAVCVQVVGLVLVCFCCRFSVSVFLLSVVCVQVVGLVLVCFCCL